MSLSHSVSLASPAWGGLAGALAGALAGGLEGVRGPSCVRDGSGKGAGDLVSLDLLLPKEKTTGTLLAFSSTFSALLTAGLALEDPPRVLLKALKDLSPSTTEA